MNIKRILVTDDEQALSNALKIKLSVAGFEVEVASDGQEALDLLAKGNFDLLLLDLVMPNIDGFEVLKEISSKYPKLNVWVLSNLSQIEDKEKAKKLGASEYFIKSDTSLAEIVDHIKNKFK